MSPFRLFAALSLACLAALPVAAAPQYTLQDLGTLAPGGGAQPQGVNQAGQVFGHATPSATNYSLPDHIFFWSPQGGMVDIGALPDVRPATSYPAGGPRTAAAMNDRGQITGESEVRASFSSDGQFVAVSHAFLWTPAADGKSGAFQDLGTLTTDSQADIGTGAIAVNNRGQITGTADALILTPQGYRNIEPAHGFLWTLGGTGGVPSNPQMKDLGLLAPSLLDESGHVVGLLNGGLTMYDGQKLVSLGSPPGFDPAKLFSGYHLMLLRVDARGDIYGNFSTPTQSTNPFVWVADQAGATTGHFVSGPSTDSSVPPPGALTGAQLPADAQVFWSGNHVFSFDPANATVGAVDLGGLLFDPFSLSNSAFPAFNTYPISLNSSKDLVGMSYLSDAPSDAFVEHAGLMYDLNLHVQGPDAGLYQLWQADGINDAGQIAALGQAAGQPGAPLRAFLLTPAGQAAPAAPVVQLIQPQPPDAGDPDQTVDIQGTGFQVGAVVTYDGAPLAAAVYAETQILAHIPAALLTAGTHTVTVIDPGGSAGSGPYVVLPVRPVPSLSAVSPATLPAGGPDATVTLLGTGLYPETQIGVGYAAPGQTFLAVLSASADHTRLTARLPAALMTQGSVLDFYAHTPGQRGAALDAPAPTLTVLNPAPTIAAIDPPTLPADTVSSFTLTVTGTGFVPDTGVYWNGQFCSVAFVSPTQLVAFVSGSDRTVPGPDTAPPGPITVSVVNIAPGGGTATATQTITDGPYPAPILTSIDPGSIASGQSTYVTLTGSHFLHHSLVHLGGLAFSPAILSDDRTQISIYLPSSAVPPAGAYPVTVVNPGPGGGTSAARFFIVYAAGGAPHTHVLWNNAGGAASLWNYDPMAGTFSQNTYGPFPGWAAKAIADGPDGKTRVLWDNADGAASLWSLDNVSGLYAHHEFGPYAGWAATKVSVGADNATHLLWTDADGRASLWNADAAGGTFTQTTYGPYPGWSAKTIADGPDGKTRLLWTTAAGQMSLWSLDNAAGLYARHEFGPYPGWAATGVSVGAGDPAHVLWTNADGRLSLWDYDAAGTFTQTTYGPFAGWSAKALADGPDGRTRVLWGSADGAVSLWSLDDVSGLYAHHEFGPYPGWSAVALSAAP